MRTLKDSEITTCGNYFIKGFLCILLSGLFCLTARTQQCPPNIDFESGTFNGWTCYAGSVYTSPPNGNYISLFPTAPRQNQHTMYSAAAHGGLRDPFGNFPVICPNGSGYSVKLGNTSGGAEAEGLSYDFTIPLGRSTYSLIYHYAVVFQDPAHEEFQQPRLVLEVWNLTDNELIDCSSFTFFPNGSPLPGFFQSGQTDSADVWCKDWSAVSINLNDMEGKDIRLFFKTADCTFRRHFGYAYVDVNTECSSEFTGATYCPDDTAVSVTAPYGYQAYKWYDNSFNLIGTQQVIRLEPPPPSGTVLAVEIFPYAGYGCRDTLYARLVDTLTLTANAGADVVSCNNNLVRIGSNRKPGVVYSWSPTTDLSFPDIPNPFANPSVTTPYELTVRSLGGGCVNKDEVIVTASIIDTSLQLIGKPLFCITTGDSAVLQVQPTDGIQWFHNASSINGATQTSHKVNKTGTYRAQLTTDEGCTLTTRSQYIVVETPRLPVRYPLQYALINSPIQLDSRSFGATYLWKPPIYLDDPADQKPFFNAPTLLEQLYTIDITTASGCLTVDTQLVKTIKEVKVYVPTAFSPDNNGRNDLFRPILIGIKQLQYFRVFNRWGQLVYNMQPNDPGWDGTVKGQLQGSEVFVWMMQGIGLDNKKYFQKGTVLLVR